MIAATSKQQSSAYHALGPTPTSQKQQTIFGLLIRRFSNQQRVSTTIFERIDVANGSAHQQDSKQQGLEAFDTRRHRLLSKFAFLTVFDINIARNGGWQGQVLWRKELRGEDLGGW